VDAVADRWRDRSALCGGVVEELAEGVGDAEELFGEAAGSVGGLDGAGKARDRSSHGWPAWISA
jgi:hypothetical protein